MNSDNTMPEGWPYTKAKTTLIRSAALVMRERGPRAATLKNISQFAGVTEPAIFRHFPGVDGVFDGLCSVVEFFHDLMAKCYAAEGAKGIDRLEKGYLGSVDILSEYSDFAYLVINAPAIFLEYEELTERVNAARQRERNLVLACVKDAAKAKEFSAGVEADFVANTVLGGAFYQYNAWLAADCGYQLRDRCSKYWKELKKLLAK